MREQRPFLARIENSSRAVWVKNTSRPEHF